MREQEVATVPAEPRSIRLLSKKWIIIIFLVIVASLLFFALSGTSLTGNVVGIPQAEETENLLKISAELGITESPIEAKQEIEEISIEIKESNGKINIGKEGVTDLSELKTALIVMRDFDGFISFDSRNILAIKGTVSKLSINDLPTSSADGKIKVRIDEPLPYNSLSLSEIYLKEYKSQSSGKVSFNEGKINLELDNESFLVEGFSGSLKSGVIGTQGIIRNGLSLKGHASNVEVGGDFQMNIYK